MDITFSAEDLAFRDEVREFFTAEFDGTVAEHLGGSQGGDSQTGMIAW